jgi:hypothetical protein
MSNLTFAPGETNISEARFSPTVVLFWLKTEMAATNRRVVTKRPNTLLGLIPLGYADAAFPLNNVASAGVEVKFSLLRVIFGFIFAIVGIALLGKIPILGVIILLFAISMLANALSAALKLQNNGGGVSYVPVSVFERRKLEHFRDEINHRLFADTQGLQHNEVMRAHFQNMQLQQQQLHAMQQNSSQHSTYPGQTGPSAWPGQQQPTQAWAGQQPPAPQYQIGDVVNGHRFDGRTWVPIA